MTQPSSGAIVLVVDDEPDIRGVFSQMLTFGGYCPIQAGTAEEALSLLEHGLQPAAVLLDLRMPGMGGLAFLLRVRSAVPADKLPVAVVTGETFIDRTTETAVRALGATLSYKPVAIDEILELTHRMVYPQ
jgi:DNA-binding NtrC family response regulator